MKISVLLGLIMLLAIGVWAQDSTFVLDGKVGIGIDDPKFELEIEGSLGFQVPDSTGRWGVLNARRLKFGWLVGEGEEAVEKQCGFFHETENQISVGFWDDNNAQLKSSLEFFPGGMLISKWEEGFIVSQTPRMFIHGDEIRLDGGSDSDQLSILRRDAFVLQSGSRFIEQSAKGTEGAPFIIRDNIDNSTFSLFMNKPIVENGVVTGYITSTTRTTGSTEDETYLSHYFKGKLVTTEVKVRPSDHTIWPDYVFGDDYKLKPLSEVKDYINNHKRLPDVPSAEQVSADGVDLGVNQAVLLKKIEELTLYVIQLEEKINQMQTEKGAE